MVWVRSEYAGELAVLSTWVAALVPWNVHYAPLSEGASLLFVRFPILQVRYVFGLSLIRGTQIGLPAPPQLVDSTGFVVSAIGFQDNTALSDAYWVWAIGALVYVAALGLSLLYYHDEDRVEGWRFDPVRVLGGLLVTTAGLFGVASYLAWGANAFPGVPIPVGVLIVGLLGGVLLAADRRD